MPNMRTEHLPKVLVTSFGDQMDVDIAERGQPAVRVVDEVRLRAVLDDQPIVSGSAIEDTLEHTGVREGFDYVFLGDVLIHTLYPLKALASLAALCEVAEESAGDSWLAAFPVSPASVESSVRSVTTIPSECSRMRTRAARATASAAAPLARASR